MSLNRLPQKSQNIDQLRECLHMIETFGPRLTTMPGAVPCLDYDLPASIHLDFIVCLS